ncbi:hypothetical protein [Pseudarthrobacter sp. AB1]|uniref:hypothetical protein n=1 Tax=Pseudarthrobacter sp. AB1 TaxID=2138309 RepID=UPI001D051BA2|nr:hypothetical protein [Pseudarthrobacter sp. AB1]
MDHQSVPWQRSTGFPKLDRFRSVIDDMLVVDLDAPRKQRHAGSPAHTDFIALQAGT